MDNEYWMKVPPFWVSNTEDTYGILRNEGQIVWELWEVCGEDSVWPIPNWSLQFIIKDIKGVEEMEDFVDSDNRF
jgi:hypothetical protein